MLARRRLPLSYRLWNLRHHAPFGRFAWDGALAPLGQAITRFVPWRWRTPVLGPFSIQPNNSIRRFEYPWCFAVAGVRPGQRVLDVGGGLGGFQFALDRAGARVINVDPGMAARGVGWPCNGESMARLNAIFGTAVELRNTTMDQAGLADESIDVAFSISVLEHLPPDDLGAVMTHVYRALRPGGRFVITLDLFLDLEPFTDATANRFGGNIRVPDLIAAAPFVMIHGDPAELYGFPEFSADRIRARLDDYMVGTGHPALAQCLVLAKPA